MCSSKFASCKVNSFIRFLAGLECYFFVFRGGGGSENDMSVRLSNLMAVNDFDFQPLFTLH